MSSTRIFLVADSFITFQDGTTSHSFIHSHWEKEEERREGEEEDLIFLYFIDN